MQINKVMVVGLITQWNTISISKMADVTVFTYSNIKGY